VPTAQVSTRVAGVNGLPVSSDFVAAFADGYRLELAAWAAAAAHGAIDGPSAWDGYVANVVAEAGVASLGTGRRESFDPGERPALYA
jgi:myo-inositol 2-dehydrogenase/D-chiro-inositol 1-dehydrogenase